MSHEKLYCGNCKTNFEVAWMSLGHEDLGMELDHSHSDTPAFCPFCGSDDIDDPQYFDDDED